MGNSQIYIYNYVSKNLIYLTNDWFSEEDPSWAINGNQIYFISNRNDYNFTNSVGFLDLIESHSTFEFDNQDIYKINKTNRKIVRITDTPWNESYPKQLKTENSIIYLSDESGINNLYITDKENSYPLTNIATGITQFSIDKNSLLQLCIRPLNNQNVYQKRFNKEFSLSL